MSLELSAESAHWPAVARASYRRLDRSEVPPSHPVGLMADRYDRAVSAKGGFRETDFSPADQPRVQPWLQILQEDVDGAFHYRFVGSGVHDLLEFSKSGQMLGCRTPDHVLQRRLKEIADSRTARNPIFSTSVLPLHGQDFIAVIRGVFPCDDDDTVIFMPVAPYRV